MSDSLLPPNATAAEVAIEAAAARVGAVPVPIRDSWNPATCPAALLPWLGWAFSVDDWDPQWSEERQRAVVAAAVEVHRRKGTRGAVLAALAAAGWPSAEVFEGWGRHFYDGSFSHDGSIQHTQPDHWAEYRVRVDTPVTNPQADFIRSMLKNIAPLRCHLKQLDFTAAPATYDGSIRHDGLYTHGVA